jgi:hypothetical protein
VTPILHRNEDTNAKNVIRHRLAWRCDELMRVALIVDVTNAHLGAGGDCKHVRKRAGMLGVEQSAALLCQISLRTVDKILQNASMPKYNSGHADTRESL